MTDHEETQARNLRHQVRTIQRDFFLTNQLLSRQARLARHRAVIYAWLCWILMAIPVTIFLCGCLHTIFR